MCQVLKDMLDCRSDLRLSTCNNVPAMFLDGFRDEHNRDAPGCPEGNFLWTNIVRIWAVHASMSRYNHQYSRFSPRGNTLMTVVKTHMTFTLANASGKRFMHHCDFNTVKYVKPGEQPNVARDLQISRRSDSHVSDRCWDPQDVKPPVQFPKNDPKVLKPMTSHNKAVWNASLFGWWLLCFQLSYVLFFMMHTCEHEIQTPRQQKWFSDIRCMFGCKM